MGGGITIWGEAVNGGAVLGGTTVILFTITILILYKLPNSFTNFNMILKGKRGSKVPQHG